MKENIKYIDCNDSYKNNKSNSNLLSVKMDINKRKISCPNMQNNHLEEYVISKFSNFQTKKSIPKKRKSKKCRLSVDLNPEKYLLENINDERIHTIMGIKKKYKDSLIFTQRKLKEKIEKEIPIIHKNTFEDKLENDIENKNDIKSKDKSRQSLDSIIKRNIQKSTQNNLLKKRKNYSNDKLIKEKIKERNRKIFQVKHVYDSLEDSEENYNSCEDNFYISPETKIIFFFDFIIIVCLVICVIYIPLKISFHKNNCISLNIFDKIMLNFIDIVFIIDLIIGFYRAYYNSELKLVNNIKSIINNYLSNYFLYDLISTLPSCSFLIYYYSDICLLYNNNNEYLFILLLCTLKLFKYIKIKNNNKFIERIYELFSKNFLTEKIYDILKMTLITFSILHLLVCCHIFIGFHFYPSWLFLIRKNYSINNNVSIYIASLYFLITTLTTVGYGDVVCISFPERIFQLIELSLGVILYSYIVSKIGDYVKSESYATMIYNNNSAILEDIRISYPKMPFKLYNQILHHLQTNFQQQKISDINILINSLPHALKYTLLFVINEKYTKNFYFFKKCYNSNFIAYTLINFVPISYKKNTLIIKEDQLIENVIFIKEGRLSLEIAINLENPEQSIKKYLNKKYNPLKNEDNTNKFENSELNHNLSSTLDIIDNKKADINDLKTLITKHTNILKEKGLDFSNIERDFDESNYQFLNISNIFKNEHYGEVFIILNKPSPLFLRVKSKKTNLFLLNKKHILHLSENFPNIWKRIFKKSLKNMKAFKQKTINVVQKYNLTYNVQHISSLMKKKTNSKKIYNIQNKSTKEKIFNSRTSLKNFLTKNILDMKQDTVVNNENNDYDQIINEDKNINKKEIDESKEKQNDDSEKIEKKDDNIEKNVFENELSNNVIMNDKVKKFNKKSKTHDFRKENQIKHNLEKDKLFQHISTKCLKQGHYSTKNFDEDNIKKMMTELRKEIDKRNHYLKLFKKSNNKIKKLYSKLVNNSIDLSNNLDKIDILDTQICDNLDITKIMLNNINNTFNRNNSLNKNDNENKNKLNKNSDKIDNLKDKNRNIKKISSNSFNSNKKTKTYYKKKIAKQISKFNMKNKSKTEQIFINLNQPLVIFNTSKSFDYKDTKYKNENNIYNKFMTLTNKSIYLNKNIFNHNNVEENIFNNNQNKINLSSIISDNSQNTILEEKNKKNIK